MGRVLLLRHVESEANRAGVGLGRTDSPPTELGLRQLDRTVEALAEERIGRVLTSPLQRARRLAQAIASAHGLEAEPAEALIEMDVGELEGLEWSAARERYGEFLRGWRGPNSARLRMPGGESLADVLERCRPLFDELLASDVEGASVVVSHNFVVKALLTHALGLPIEEWRRIDVGLASISAVRSGDGHPVVERLNERAHLARLGADLPR